MKHLTKDQKYNFLRALFGNWLKKRYGISLVTTVICGGLLPRPMIMSLKIVLFVLTAEKKIK